MISFRPALSPHPDQSTTIQPMIASARFVRMWLGRPRSGWRPLILFWLSVLTIGATGGAFLELLGPPARPPASLKLAAQEPAADSAQPRAIAAEAKLSVTVLPSSRAPEQAPVPGRPAPGPQPTITAAPGTAGPDGPDQTSGATRNRSVAVFHPSGSDSVKEVAQQMAAQAGVAPDQIRTEAVADVPQRAIIRFYSQADHALARRMGRELAQLGYTWQIENRSARASPSGPQSLEVWLPRRPGRD